MDEDDAVRNAFAAAALVGIGMWIPCKDPYTRAELLVNDGALTARAEWAYRQADAMVAAGRKSAIADTHVDHHTV